jgi:hypothetical protein
MRMRNLFHEGRTTYIHTLFTTVHDSLTKDYSGSIKEYRQIGIVHKRYTSQWHLFPMFSSIAYIKQ